MPMVASVPRILSVLLVVSSESAASALPEELTRDVLRLDAALMFGDIAASATQQERQRLAREVHDGLAQDLASLGYLIDALDPEDDAIDERISDVRGLRAHQFVEDAGPLAHPVRPAVYREINNFYTATVYEKGAEVVRMLKTMLGPEHFRSGMDLYFARHDGEAATVEQFVQCFADVSGIDLEQFMRWYSQAGTPEVVEYSKCSAWSGCTRG